MYIPDELVEEVREKNDIVEVIGQYVKLTRKGSSYFGLCPFHTEKTGSFSVSPQKQMYYCFGCHKGGNVISFLMDYENDTFQEAVKILGDKAGIVLPESGEISNSRQNMDEKQSMLNMYKEAAIFYYRMLRSKAGEIGYNYLRKRELSDDTIKRFGLGYAPKYGTALYAYLKEKGYEDKLMIDAGLVGFSEKSGLYDRFWNRVMFPIMDVRHRVIGFGGRVMGEGEPKYLNSPETKIFDKSRNLYGLDIAKTNRTGYFILCEGYMDVIALHQAGYTQAVASLGTSLTAGHCHLISRYTKLVYLCYDSDSAGINAAIRALPMLNEEGIQVKVISMKPAKDPDELIKTQGGKVFEEKLKEAESSFMFELTVMEDKYNFSEPEQKTAFYREAVGKLLNFKDAIERDIYLDAIAVRYGQSKEKLSALLGSVAREWDGRRLVKRPSSSRLPKEKKDGLERSQKLLITWMISDRELFDVIKKYINPEDFNQGLLRQVVTMLYEQAAQGEIVPARILDHITDSNEQAQVTALFHEQLNQIEKKEELEKALTETIIKVKDNALDRIIEEMDKNDMVLWQKILAEKRELQKLHILL